MRKILLSFVIVLLVTLFSTIQAEAAVLVTQPNVSSGDSWTVNYSNGQTFEFDMNFSGQWPVLLCKNSASGSVGIWFQGNEVYVKASGGFTKLLGGISSGSNTHYKVVCNNNDVFLYGNGNLVGNASDASINVGGSNFVNNPRIDFVANGFTQMTNFSIADSEFNVAPTITTLTVPAGTQLQNTLIGITGNFTDTGTSDTHTATIDWGDGTSSSGTVTESNGSGSVTGSHSYSRGGDFTIKLTVTDQDGASSRREAQVHVNLSPNTYRIVASSVGTVYTATGYFSDSDSTSWTGVVNYGDGSGEQALQIDNQNRTFSLNHTYSNSDKFTITITITDNQGQPSSSFTTKSNLLVVQPNVGSGDSWTVNYNNGLAFEFDMNYSGQWPVLTCKNSSAGNASVWFQSNEVYVKTSSGFSKLLGGISSGSNTHYKVVCNNDKVTVYTDGNVLGEAIDSSINVPSANFVNQPRVDFVANGDTRMTNFTIFNVNTAPTINEINDATINEGSVYTSTGSFNDLDSTSWTATVNYGDGSGAQPLTLNGNSFTLNHEYSTVGNYTLTVNITDNEGLASTETANITVNPRPNEAPVVAPISNENINEGDTYTANSSFTDSDSSSWTATVDYGDGAGAVNLPLNTDKTFSLNHQYTVAGTYTVTVVVTDNQSATGTTTATVTVNAPPQISGLSDTEINYQDDFIQSGSFTDSDSSSWTATVDYGDGFGAQTLSLNADHTFTLDRTYPAAGTYNATITVTDNQGATGTANITIKVNAPPHINQILGATINEGQSYTENGSFSDPDSASWTGVINYGDGSGSQPLTLNPDNTFSLSHLYQDNGTYTVIVTITDNQGAIGTKTATVTVNNVAPSVSGITASIDPVQVNTSTVASATFTDVGVFDTHTAVWNWGDGTTSNATISSGSISNNHTYTTAGVYVITLTVTDNNGGSTTSTYQYLSVYSPTSQGLFSAGQKYTSPTGAYPQNPNLTGNVKFGLSYKYQGTVPTSHKEFSMDFNQANLHFNATSVNSLVISNGMGTLTGAGTLNGATGYDFLITGSESGNTIRIQIKNHQTGAVVYDTQPGDPANAAPTTVVTGNVLAH